MDWYRASKKLLYSYSVGHVFGMWLGKFRTAVSSFEMWLQRIFPNEKRAHHLCHKILPLRASTLVVVFGSHHLYYFAQSSYTSTMSTLTTSRNPALPPRAPRSNKKKSYLGRNRDASSINSRKASIKAAMDVQLRRGEHAYPIHESVPCCSLDDFNSSWADLQFESTSTSKPCSWMNLELEDSFGSDQSNENSKNKYTRTKKQSTKGTQRKSLDSSTPPQPSSSKRRRPKLHSTSKTSAQKRAVGATAA